MVIKKHPGGYIWEKPHEFEAFLCQKSDLITMSRAFFTLVRSNVWYNSVWLLRSWTQLLLHQFQSVSVFKSPAILWQRWDGNFFLVTYLISFFFYLRDSLSLMSALHQLIFSFRKIISRWEWSLLQISYACTSQLRKDLVYGK